MLQLDPDFSDELAPSRAALTEVHWARWRNDRCSLSWLTMRYGNPRVFALQAIRRYLGALLRESAKRGIDLGKWVGEKFIMVGLWIVGLACLGIALNHQDDDILGHYSLRRIANDSVSFDGKRVTPRELEGLTSGHRCDAWANVDAASAPACVDGQGQPRMAQVVGRENWSTSCCIAVVPESDQEPSAKFRRFFLWSGFPGGKVLGVILMLIFMVLGALLSWLAASAIFYLLIFMPAVAFTSAAATFGAILRLFYVVVRTSRTLHVSPWTPPGLNGRAVAIAQLSDLHVSEGLPYELRVDPGEYGGAIANVTGPALHARLQIVVKRALADMPELLVATGDLTDVGHHEEWLRLQAIIKGAVSANECAKLTLVPGNHDVSLNVGESPDITGAERKEREQRMLKALSAISPGCPMLPSIKKFETSAGEVNLISLDSCRYKSRFILSNAIGKIGREQLRWLVQQLCKIRGPLVVIMHHHVALPKGRISAFAPVASAMELLKLPVDIRPLMRALLNYSQADGNTVLVLHGHQHEELRLQVRSKSGGCVKIVGLGSSTLGALVSTSNGRLQLDGIPRYARIGYSRDDGWLFELVRLTEDVDSMPA